MVIHEDIEPESHHSREMYAYFGLAMYQAQVMEAGVKNALIVTDPAVRTRDDFDAQFDRNFATVLGRLLKRLKPFLVDDPQLVEDLATALALRNFLAHHYFWDRAADAVSWEGRARMIRECAEIAAVLEDVASRLGDVVGRFSDARGTPRQVFEQRVAEANDRLIQQRKAEANSCGRCRNSLDGATHLGSFRRCPACGALSFLEA